MKGSYVLLIELPESRVIQVGRLGLRTFPRGFYAYVGSALNRLGPRIARHLRVQKKCHWHIDYLLKEASIKQVVICETSDRVECRLAQTLAKELPSVVGFGSSDCRCSSHLYFAPEPQELEHCVLEAATTLAKPFRLERHPCFSYPGSQVERE
ncbi:MAG: GIY-YIG nuclease family protein [Chloroflexi bacterium]|nr:MAG: GIY-YIG nuclease family protein [Chloroflexota bacterium]